MRGKGKKIYEKGPLFGLEDFSRVTLRMGRAGLVKRDNVCRFAAKGARNTKA